MGNKFRGKVLAFTKNWYKNQEDIKSHVDAIKVFNDPVVVENEVLQNYAKELHNNRYEYDTLLQKTEYLEKQIKIAEAIRTLKEYLFD